MRQQPKLGLIIAELMLYHLGHEELIRWAKTHSDIDHLVVIIGYKPNHYVSGQIRAEWVRDLHPDIEVIVTPNDLPDAPEPWAERTLELLQGRKPDVVFSSEDYGPYYSQLMGAEHRMYDLARRGWTISGTLIRNNPVAYWHYLVLHSHKRDSFNLKV